MATASELLDAVNTAILALISEEYASQTVNGRTYLRQDLEKLRAMRKQLQAECRTTAGTIRLADVSGA